MKYQVYKLEFNTAVHFGKRKLEDGEAAFSADMLFSALCHEANAQYGNDGIKELLQYVEACDLRFSDAFPYHDDELYIPKPMMKLEKDIESDSEEKKAYKKLNYIKWSQIQEYINGNFPVKDTVEELKYMGKRYIKTNASVIEGSNTTPYSVGTFWFNRGWGLYFILAFKDDEVRYFVEDLLLGLELTGIGGKRSSGLGKFTLKSSNDLSENCSEMLSASDEYDRYMTLTTSMASEEELEKTLANAQYKLVRKSGFVASETYAQTLNRKRDFFMFQAGATFMNRFDGVVEDVSFGGNHPVYRYGKPIFLGVKL